MAAPWIFIWEAVALTVWGRKWMKPTAAEAVCRPHLQRLTAKTITIRNCGINWQPDSWPVCFMVGLSDISQSSAETQACRRRWPSRSEVRNLALTWTRRSTVYARTWSSQLLGIPMPTFRDRLVLISGVARILLKGNGTRARGARVPKFVVTVIQKWKPSGVRSVKFACIRKLQGGHVPSAPWLAKPLVLIDHKCNAASLLIFKNE